MDATWKQPKRSMSVFSTQLSISPERPVDLFILSIPELIDRLLRDAKIPYMLVGLRLVICCSISSLVTLCPALPRILTSPLVWTHGTGLPW
jgi:hypothetical protein